MKAWHRNLVSVAVSSFLVLAAVGSDSSSGRQSASYTPAPPDPSTTAAANLSREVDQFAREKAPELMEAIQALEDTEAQYQQRISELESLLSGLGRAPAKDPELRKWKLALTQVTEKRRGARKSLEDAFILYRKFLLDPSAEQDRTLREATRKATSAARTSVTKFQRLLLVKSPPPTAPQGTGVPCGTNRCEINETCCSGTCVTLDTDAHCGSCDTACEAGAACCGGQCASLSSNDHCGACGISCHPGEACCQGSCQALNVPDHCGSCGKSCPGLGTAGAVVTCEDASTGQCLFACMGEHFDVDGSFDNGCERTALSAGHTGSSATFLGDKGCSDEDSSLTIEGSILSDAREHRNPLPEAFDARTGTMPNHYTVRGTGETDWYAFCRNDYGLKITTRGGSSNKCYRVTVTTANGSQSMDVTGAESADMASTGYSSAYPSGTHLTVSVEKTCPLPLQEAVQYSIQMHL